MGLNPALILRLKKNMEPVKIGITMGDPSGIGPDVIAKALARPGINKLGRFLVIGDKWVFNKITSHTLTGTGKSQVTSFEFVDLNNVSHKKFKLGKVRAEFGQAAIEYVRKAVELIKNREIDCLVTAPISKQAVNLAGYRYGGHTEFLARAFGKKSQDLVMMLLNKYLRISLVTRHLALKKISLALSQEAIYKTIVITCAAMRGYFGIAHPRIYVAALNPHAGEGGVLGKEEIEKILPAIKRAKGLTRDILGPLPADSAFSCAKQGKADAVIAMYHDQALIPLKVLDPETGVNLTLGLGFVRTSPLHGTAFDIAGKNIASENSFISAVKTAVECTNNLKRSSLY